MFEAVDELRREVRERREKAKLDKAMFNRYLDCLADTLLEDAKRGIGRNVHIFLEQGVEKVEHMRQLRKLILAKGGRISDVKGVASRDEAFRVLPVDVYRNVPQVQCPSRFAKDIRRMLDVDVRKVAGPGPDNLVRVVGLPHELTNVQTTIGAVNKKHRKLGRGPIYHIPKNSPFKGNSMAVYYEYEYTTSELVTSPNGAVGAWLEEAEARVHKIVENSHGKTR